MQARRQPSLQIETAASANGMHTVRDLGRQGRIRDAGRVVFTLPLESLRLRTRVRLARGRSR